MAFDPLPYHQGPGLWRDLLVIEGPDAALPAPLPHLRSHRRQSVTVHVDADLPDPFSGFFLGIGRIGTRLVTGPGPLGDLPASGATDIGTLGPFLTCRPKDGGLLIEADAFGNWALYHARFGGSFYVSNRLHLIAEAAHAAGHRIALDLRVLTARWFADSGLTFSPTVAGTLIAGCTMIHPGDSLRIAPSASTPIKAAAHDRSPLTPAAYSALIAQGVEEIRANLTAIAGSGHRVVATLTGGRDSRLLLAGLVSLGLHRKTPFWTMDTRPEETAIATGLVRHFGLEFDTTPPGDPDPDTAHDRVLRHRSMLFGQGASFLPAFDHLAGHLGPGMILLGGYGEVYRTVYTKRFPLELLARPYSGALFRRFLERFGTFDTYLPPGTHQRVRNVMGAEIAGLQGDSFGEKLDTHYAAYATRNHFSAQTLPWTPCMMLNPLCAPALRAAAWRVPWDVRRSGRILFDAIREMHEIAAYLPYDGAPEPDRTGDALHRASRFDSAPPDLHPEPALLQAAYRRKFGSAVSPGPGLGAALAAMLPAQIEALDSVPELRHMLSFGIRDRRLPKLYSDPDSRFFRAWAGRIAGAADILAYGGGVVG